MNVHRAELRGAEPRGALGGESADFEHRLGRAEISLVHETGRLSTNATSRERGKAQSRRWRELKQKKDRSGVCVCVCQLVPLNVAPVPPGFGRDLEHWKVDRLGREHWCERPAVDCIGL